MRRFTLGVVLSVALSICGRFSHAEDAADAKTIDGFRALCGTKAEAANSANAMAVSAKDGWYFLAGELRHISVGKFWGDEAAKVSRASKPEWADPTESIVDFKTQLEKAGIELLLVPVPPKAVIYPEMLADGLQASPRLDSQHAEFYKLLTEKGVKVLELSAEFGKERSAKATQLLYCKTDTHWSPFACELTARMIKQRLVGRDWLAGAKPGDFKSQEMSREINGDLANGGPKETLAAHVVSRADGKSAIERTSPVLLLGDSHCLVFQAGEDMHGTGGGLADHLAAELGISIDLLGVRGSGATSSRISLMQRVRSEENYLAGKKLVIWCFTAREFTESQGWRKVPIVK